ncbi:inner nuclear membrane protein Man1 isoform X2 [Parasteatoda tepidariorum]|uniref:inner nuclear membrane protein Man1 isoform X2 n=1 Tax=Parasteatoda tepidariorum TaxID=114398 RepID=UPI001C725394|nr:inner nuclear membrane protein Man1 isoform X2 [Parasteatoda tepidariorum]
MANRLTDDELRESLKEYGEDVGPITPTTRSTWERRLNNFRKSKGLNRKSTLNAFSSDDSEIENSTSSTRRSKRTSLNSSYSPSASSFDDNTFKKPTSPSFTVQGRHLEKPNHLKNQNFLSKLNKNVARSTFDVETSDSDFDSDFSPLFKTSRRTRKKSSRNSTTTDFKDASPSRNSQMPVNSFRGKPPLDSTWQPSSSESRFHHYNSTVNRLKPDHIVGQSYHTNGYLSSTLTNGELNEERVEEGSPTNYSHYHIVGQSYHTNGYLSNTLTNGELNEERVEEGSSTNYSHCISWFILFGAATFFIVIGILYVMELQKNTHLADSKFCEKMNEEDCENLILLSRELHQLLTTNAGIYDCATDEENLTREMTIPDARIAMKDYFNHETKYEGDKFEFLFTKSVLLLIRFPEMGIKSYPVYEEEKKGVLSLQVNETIPFSALEAIQGSKSLMCRIRLSLKWTLTKIILLCGVGVLLSVCFFVTKLWKKRKEDQEKMFYEMVEKVIDILQETSEWSVSSEPYKAVVKVRDAVIPAKERRGKLWLWDRVVAFIEENESRVSVEYRTINGEDFKVWKWQPFTTTENEGGKQGKVWQGQAFSSLGKGRNTMYSLSPCLKIRNMFDSEVEYEESWQTSIQDAILEKCEGNDGIRHIAIDTSNNEGCVYMLCSSSETAGKAFNDLHGWWFDGKLVTVKYIPYKRYLERFPESEHCTASLKPSNNKRLSLSTPFFSSALERS